MLFRIFGVKCQKDYLTAIPVLTFSDNSDNSDSKKMEEDGIEKS